MELKPFRLLIYISQWFVVLYFITLCWVGAEYLFEGAVHASKVDFYVASVLAFFIVREVRHGIRK